MPTRLVDALARTPRDERDRLLVLFACVLHDLSLHTVTRLTPTTARQALDDREGLPLVSQARERLEAFVASRGVDPGGLLFPSQRMWPFDEPQPVSRITAWRIVRRAVVEVFGPKVDGSWTFVRTLLGGSGADDTPGGGG